MASAQPRFHRTVLFWMALTLGAACLFAGTVATITAHNLFNAGVFGDRLEESLADPRVASYAAEALTRGVLQANPDLVAARPLLVATSEGLVSSRPFGVLAARAAEQAHQAFFSTSAQNLVLSLPDVEVLLKSALAQASPELAAKIPAGLTTVLGSLSSGGRTDLLVNVLQLGPRLRWIATVMLTAGPLLLVAAVVLARSRRRGLVRVGGSLVAVALFVALLLPLGRTVAGAMVSDPAQRAALQGLWSVYFAELRVWAIFVGGIGLVIAAGATSVLEAVNPFERVRFWYQWVQCLPQTRVVRFLSATVLLCVGGFTMWYPQQVLSALAVLAGTGIAYLGVREFFRVLLDSLHHKHGTEDLSSDGWLAVHVAIAAVLGALLLIGWIVWRKPSITPIAASTVKVCNGMAELCDRRVDQVVFPGAHNAMSHQMEPGWMFPHHQAGIPEQLRAGIRALLFDVHYGMPGGSRIKTDFTAAHSREKFVKALGEEGFAAAMRIRNRLVGVREDRRDVYLCHGLCELGAYPLEPVLKNVREFLVQHPDEVLLFIIEDYVTPQDLAAVFERAGLTGYLYRGDPKGGWPTLRQLIEEGQRLIVFTESGAPGVDWLRPAFSFVQETPYTFHKVEEMSCVANRGGTSGSLFLMNHWIETTPAPRPSNAAIVNAKPFLLERAARCEGERGKAPNILAVDFFGSGDVLGAAKELNRQKQAARGE